MEILQKAYSWLPAKYLLLPLPLSQHIHKVLSTEQVLQKSQDAQHIAISPVKIQIPGLHPKPMYWILLGRDRKICKIYTPPQGNSSH